MKNQNSRWPLVLSLLVLGCKKDENSNVSANRVAVPSQCKDAFAEFQSRGQSSVKPTILSAKTTEIVDDFLLSHA